ncbi:ABC transporter ATP-binding protein [Actinomarinicola tropica]|uniref:ATP-binding cassette domain-containing protein n=1 Tax=Actinomarinicola tropica TaxID=2789776 RepID=A0A5Q2RQY2_9ACTN|nr:ATP-binding cassette domain-containing protein [Actinomarinicola tropica]
MRLYLPRVRPLLVGVVAFQALQALFTLLLPRVTARIIDEGVVADDRDAIWRVGGLLLVVAFAQVVAMVIGIHFAARSSMGVGREIRRDLFHKVTGFSAQEVGRFGPPTLITRITNDVQQVQTAVQMAATMAVVAPLTFGFGTFMAVREDAALSLVLLVAVPIIVVIVGVMMSKAHPAFTAMQDRIDVVNTVLREQITGLRVVRAFVREPTEVRRFDDANQSLTSTALRAGRIMAILFPLVIVVQNGASVAVVWYGAIRIDAGESTLGSLVAFLGYIVLVLMSVLMAGFMFTMLPRAAVSGQRIMEALDAEPTVVAPASPRQDVPRTGRLELRDVTFGYPGAEEPVVKDVSFTVTPGQTTAIIGSTGSGKTTLLNLVPRLYDVTGGAVLVEGVDVRELALDDLWSRIGLVPQKPFLFSGSVADNLRYGKGDATEEEMWAALAVAQAAEFVSSMPGGLEAAITQGGTNVSGGQRQRLAIARALVRKPQIYLFDDSFSALDLATDARLRAALPAYTSGASFLVVAQRVSTIVDADQIVVLEGGEVVGLGTHDELVAGCPTYQEIVESQRSVQEAV